MGGETLAGDRLADGHEQLAAAPPVGLAHASQRRLDRRDVHVDLLQPVEGGLQHRPRPFWSAPAPAARSPGTRAARRAAASVCIRVFQRGRGRLQRRRHRARAGRAAGARPAPRRTARRMYSPLIQFSLSQSKRAPARCTRLEVEGLDQLVEREELLLGARVPAEQRQVVDERLRQVAHAPRTGASWPRGACACTSSCRPWRGSAACAQTPTAGTGPSRPSA